MTAIWLYFKIVGTGMLAIALFMGIKINDLTDANPNLNFLQVTKLFLAKATSSYITALIAVVAYAVTKDYWIELFFTGTVTPGLIERLLKLQVLMSFFVGAGFQYGTYKFFLKKADNIMKIWSGNPPQGAPDPNTEPPKIKVDGTTEK